MNPARLFAGRETSECIQISLSVCVTVEKQRRLNIVDLVPVGFTM